MQGATGAGGVTTGFGASTGGAAHDQSVSKKTASIAFVNLRKNSDCDILKWPLESDLDVNEIAEKESINWVAQAKRYQ